MDGGDSNAEGVNCQDADRPLVSSESVAKLLMNGGFSLGGNSLFASSWLERRSKG